MPGIAGTWHFSKVWLLLASFFIADIVLPQDVSSYMQEALLDSTPVLSSASVFVSSSTGFSSNGDKSWTSGLETSDVPPLPTAAVEPGDSLFASSSDIALSASTSDVSNPSFSLVAEFSSLYVSLSSASSSAYTSAFVESSGTLPFPLWISSYSPSLNSVPVLQSSWGLSSLSAGGISSSLSLTAQTQTEHIISVCPSVLPLSILCENYTVHTNSSAEYASSSNLSVVSTIYVTLNYTSSASLSAFESTVPVVSTPSYSFWDVSTDVTPVELSTSVPYYTVADSFSRSVSAASILPGYSDVVTAIPIGPALGKCEAVLLDMASLMTNLTSCVLQHVWPLQVCEKCLHQYEDLRSNREVVYLHCGKKLIEAYNDQYQLIPMMYGFQQSVWETLSCEKCFVRDASGHVEPTKQFTDFIQLYNDTAVCIQNYTFISVLTPNVTFNASTTQQVCTNCQKLYQQLQKSYTYYSDSLKDSKTRWCADINWAVNVTRHRWGRFGCEYKARDLESIIALTCFFCFLPIIFYIGIKLHADVKERKIETHLSNYESD